STGNVGVVNISNLGEYTIDYENLEHISEPERKLTSYLLEDGDVLLPARGTATRIAVFRQQDYPCITSSNIIVIRPRQDLLDSVYLKMFFDSPLGAKILASVQQGTAVVNLSFRDLQEVEIPLPPMEEQKQMTDEYQRELDVYLKTIQNAEERWNNTLEKLQAML
ncbi:MAG: restriction endonuclease subunit S, partial [Schwartzia sp.]|nr:restriction endonuclease subunit S [Schwartzia sp. (in: firmicutes)]